MNDYKLVQYHSDPQDFQEKERLYLEVRRREGRVLSDEVAMALPSISADSPYVKEWRWRKRSFERLKKHLSAKTSGSIRILDLGCGNGWMANRLAENPRWDVSAVDLNREELEQGARLFGRENLRFYYADILANSAAQTIPTTAFQNTFDVIILAASVQYFPDLETLFATLRSLLNASGEIHLIDSNFYKNETARDAARRRTLEYYAKIGVPEMAAHYHHHLWTDIQKAGGQNHNDSFWIRILQKFGQLAPFPWIRLD
jgi:SAM-dependent methyltransferase